MLKRILSGIVGLAVVIPAIHVSPKTFAVLLLVAFTVCLLEFYRIAFRQKDPEQMNMFACTIISGLWFLVGMYSQIQGSGQVSFLPLIAILLFLMPIVRIFFVPYDLQRVPGILAISLFGFVYIVLPFAHFFFLRLQADGALWIFLIFAGTFGGDTGAYFVGRFLGRHKLAPRISPHKTWEGFTGQIVGAFSGVYLLHTLAGPKSMTLRDMLVISAICGVLGALGDLFESMLKRGFGVKDSGSIMPGHGGLLDRVDGLLFTGPAVTYYLVACKF